MREKREKEKEAERDHDEERLSKLWWHSRTIIIAILLGLCGVGITLYGYYTKQPTLIGSGGTLSGSSLIMAALRMVTNSRDRLVGPWIGYRYGSSLGVLD